MGREIVFCSLLLLSVCVVGLLLVGCCAVVNEAVQIGKRYLKTEFDSVLRYILQLVKPVSWHHEERY